MSASNGIYRSWGTNMANNDAWDLLLSKYFEGSITSEELKRLEEELLRDSEFAHYVAQWCVMHRQIGDLLTEDRLHELMDQFVTRSPARRHELFRKQPRAARSLSKGAKNVLAWPFGNRFRVAALSIAALLLVTAIILFERPRNRPGIARSEPPASSGTGTETGPARLADRKSTV